MQKKKICLKKNFIIGLAGQFSVQQFFALCNWQSFIVWHFLTFEVVIIAGWKNILDYDAGPMALYNAVFYPLYSGLSSFSSDFQANVFS